MASQKEEVKVDNYEQAMNLFAEKSKSELNSKKKKAIQNEEEEEYYEEDPMNSEFGGGIDPLFGMDPS